MIILHNYIRLVTTCSPTYISVFFPLSRHEMKKKQIADWPQWWEQGRFIDLWGPFARYYFGGPYFFNF